MSDISRIASNIGFRIGSFGNTREYEEKFGSINPSESLIKETMELVQKAIGGNFTYLGGQTVRPFSMGMRQLRVPSVDIDAIVTDLDTLKYFYQFCRENKYQTFLHHTMHVSLLL